MSTKDGWHLYNIMCNYGDLLPTKFSCNTGLLREQLKKFDNEWRKFNPGKMHILRDGLSVTSIDGNFGGNDLDSLKDVMERTGEVHYEASYTTLTPVYHECDEVKKLLDPWKDWIARSHFIRLPPGGFFPTHCDGDRVGDPEVFRIIVPIQNVNPPTFHFMFGGGARMEPIYWNQGQAYFMNTHKPHCLFNNSVNSDSLWLIMNVKVCEEAVQAQKFAVYT